MWYHIIGEQRMFKIWEIVNEDQELSIAFEHRHSRNFLIE